MNKGSSITANTASSIGGGIASAPTGKINMVTGSYIAGNNAKGGGGIFNNLGSVLTFKDSNGNIIALWPGYDTATDTYGFFHTVTTPHNNPNDIATHL